MSATLVLVTGPPGTGKSTVSAIAARQLGAPVLSHDWAMAALSPYAEIQHTLLSMSPQRRRRVGWSVLWSLALAQLREGRSAVLDGVARSGETLATRRVAGEAGARSLVVLTSCTSSKRHRALVEGRRRGIPGWYELDWEHVSRSRARWRSPADVDLKLDAGDDLGENGARLLAVLGAR